MFFLVFGISVNSPLLMADEEGSNASQEFGSNASQEFGSNASQEFGSNASQEFGSNASQEFGSNASQNEDDEDKDDRDKKRDRTRERREKNDLREEIEIEIEDGKRKVRIKRRFIDEDGNEVRIDIRIEEIIKDGRLIRKIRSKRKIRGEYFEVETELELEDDFEGNRSRIRAKLSNGNFSLIDVLPEEAHEIALERLRSRNLSLKLIEIRHKNIPRVVYNIQTNKNGRFLGVFKLKIKMEAQIDPETGELLGIAKPWWAFLVSGEESDQTGEDEDEIPEPEENETDENETEQNETEGNETVRNLTA